MTTPQQVKQALELALSLATTLEKMTKEEATEMIRMTKELNLVIRNVEPAIYEIIGQKTWQERYHGLNKESSELRKEIEVLKEKNEYLEQRVEELNDFSLSASPKEKTTKKAAVHPIDTLLKKGKVELSEKRYYHLTEIYDELTSILKVNFLSAKQNKEATWFPLECQGDKSAALFLHASEWSIAPLSRKANGELSGVWEDFDLGTQMQSNRPEVDLDDY